MNLEIKAPRGTSDILPERAQYWDFLALEAMNLFESFGYQKIIFPTFEYTEIFQKGIGQSTDIVQKEMYTFLDKAERSLTLRPEGTASVVRAYVEHKMWNRPQPVKLYYYGSMFRYERPQSGRYREFWQIGAESIGSLDPLIDVELIILLMDYYRQIGLQMIELKINSMGCPLCQPAYIEDLRSFLESKVNEICSQCKKRYKLNPLRVFDCKNEQCQKIYKEAPQLSKYLCSECQNHFARVKKGLDLGGESFQIDSSLVRGFDYYTKTTFEICSPLIGAQDAIGGGGRYDGLVELYGGPPTPGIGFALGLERVTLALEAENSLPQKKETKGIYVVSIDDELRTEAFNILLMLRRSGFQSDMDYTGKSLRGQMKQADKKGARFAIILGPDEIESGTYTVRDLNSGTQENVNKNNLVEFFKKDR